EVINPGGGSSGQFTFSVQPPPSDPVIDSTNPVSPIATGSAQAFTINGSHFVCGGNVTLRTGTSTYANRPQSACSSTAITINPNSFPARRSSDLEVINPGGGSSGQFTFSVQP